MDVSICPSLYEMLTASQKSHRILFNSKGRWAATSPGPPSQFQVESAIVEFYLAVLNEDGTNLLFFFSFLFFPLEICRILIIKKIINYSGRFGQGAQKLRAWNVGDRQQV